MQSILCEQKKNKIRRKMGVCNRYTKVKRHFHWLNTKLKNFGIGRQQLLSIKGQLIRFRL